jgi:cytosine/adenosine deaminase-related metal-dependent hydrolase
VLELAREQGKLIHVHTDQRNEPTESGTERLIEAVQKYGAPESPTGEPMVWAVHMLSPSTYDEERFDRMATGLAESNIGVICCPSAALGMRQLRPLMTPTYNSIPRVLELLVAGVHIRLGSDNIADICSPSTTADLTDEVFILSAALRFYHIGVLAKLAAGVRLDADDREMIREHLEENDRQIEKVLRATHQQADR